MQLAELKRLISMPRQIDSHFRYGENNNLLWLEKSRKDIKALNIKNAGKIKYGLSRTIRNLEDDYAFDIHNNKGFDIDLNIEYTGNNQKDEPRMKASSGIHSSKFGDYDSDNIVYSCNCGRLVLDESGFVCDLCSTHTDIKIYNRGWIVLKNHKVFNPDYFLLMMSYIDIKKSGISKKALMEGFSDYQNPMNMFSYIALQHKSNVEKFINKYVIESHKELFLKNIDCALTSKIPVISSDFRFYRVEKGLKDSHIKTHKYNSPYIKMTSTARALNNMSELTSRSTVSSNLTHLNETLAAIFELIITDLGGDKKKSVMRGRIPSKHKNGSCKCIVESIKGIDDDEAIVPYQIFGTMALRQFTKELQELGLSRDGVSRLRHSIPNVEDKVILNKLLRYLKDEYYNIITFYRAPTITSTNIVALKVKSLCNDLVIKISDIALSKMGGDKDGDSGGGVIPVKVVMSAFFTSYHPSKGILNKTTCENDSSYELPESNYYLVFDTLRYAENRTMVNGKSPTLIKI